MDTNIGYKLVPNMTATAGKAPYLGMAIPVGSLAYDNILARMVEAGTFINKATCQWMLNAFYEYAAAVIAGDTVRVSTGTVSLYPAISGSFDSEDAAFDPVRNRLYVGASLSKSVRDAVAGLSPAYGGEASGESAVEISSELEIASQCWNAIDGTKEFRLAGIDLQVPDGEDESLALVAKDRVTKVCDITVVSTDEGQRLVCRLPADVAIAKGAYFVRLASHGIDPTARLAVREKKVTLISPVVPPAGPTITKFCTGGENGILRPAQFVNIEGDFDAADAENLPVATGAYQGATRTVQWSLDKLQVNTSGKMVASYSTDPAFQFDDGATVTLHFRGATATATYNPQS